MRIQKWVVFSEAWNEIIDHFRDEDIISNREMNYLKFSRFGNVERFTHPIYLPVFQTAGVIDNCISSIESAIREGEVSQRYLGDEDVFSEIEADVTMRNAVSEAWELGTYLLGELLGHVHKEDINTIYEIIEYYAAAGEVTSATKVEKLRGLVSNFAGVINVLEKGLGRRKARKPTPLEAPSKKEAVMPPPSAGSRAPRFPSSSSMRRVVSTNSLSMLQDHTTKPAASMGGDLAFGTLGAERRGPAAKTKLAAPASRARPQNVVILDALRDQVRDKLRNFAQGFKGMLKNTAMSGKGREVADRLTFLLSMENGFIWNDNYASTQLDLVSKNELFTTALHKMHGLISAHPDDVEPKSKEAKRRLTFFVNSLFMDIPNSPNMQDMMSWNVMTPFYSEDVTYNKSDLTKTEKTLGVSVLLYLQTLYKADWQHFVERMKITDEGQIWSKKYVDEVRRWASLRAQTLSRTVSGMMLNEKALRLLARLEGHDTETINDLMCEKVRSWEGAFTITTTSNLTSWDVNSLVAAVRLHRRLPGLRQHEEKPGLQGGRH